MILTREQALSAWLISKPSWSHLHLAWPLRLHGDATQVPEWLEEPLLHLVHHATTTLDGLIEKALAKYGGRYVVGEELAATDEGKERPCVIRTITSAKRSEGQSHLHVLQCGEATLFLLCELLHLFGRRPLQAGHIHPALPCP